MEIKMIYMSQEEVDAKIDAGDIETINGVISGEVVIGEAPEGEVQESTETPIEEETTIVEQPIVDEAPIVEETPVTDDSKAEYEALLAKYKDEAEKSEKALKDAEAERAKAKEARELLESIKKQNVTEQGGVTYTSPSINEDDTDVDLAGSYSKNNRAMLDMEQLVLTKWPY
jgi:S-DNA-T family DNA segregation ATPase FtsK/SpoIIIE